MSYTEVILAPLSVSLPMKGATVEERIHHGEYSAFLEEAGNSDASNNGQANIVNAMYYDKMFQVIRHNVDEKSEACGCLNYVVSSERNETRQNTLIW